MHTRDELVGHALKRKPNLRICISNDLKPPSEEYELLLAFHFGAAGAPLDHPALVSLGLRPVDRECVYECWWYAGKVTYRDSGAVRIVECEDYAVVTCAQMENGIADFSAFTRATYIALLRAMSSCRHRTPVKIWNYMGGINDGDDDLERYRQFSIGRAEAFREVSISDEHSPTGTAIGTLHSKGLSLVAIATSNDFNRVENPRQVSAYRYPRNYGPSSPKFGRGGIVTALDHELYLISGTASVVGHESAHPCDVNRQIAETLTNLDALCDSLNRESAGGRRLMLDHDSVMRVYLRNAEDRDAVADAIHGILPLDQSQLVFLHGNICRRELMVEIDGVGVLGSQLRRT